MIAPSHPRRFGLLAIATTLVVCIVALAPVLADAQQVRIVGQFANLESVAGSGCPEDPPVEPDLDDFFSTQLVPLTQATAASMQSSCGSAAAGAALVSAVSASAITLTVDASMELEQHGGGSGNGTVEVTFEIIETTDFELTMSATTTSTGSDGVAVGGIELEVLSGPTIFGLSELRPDWDLQQPGQLEPGTYVLRVWCAAERTARTFPDGTTLFMDGSDTLTVTAALGFPGSDVVARDETTLGEWRSRYRGTP